MTIHQFIEIQPLLKKQVKNLQLPWLEGLAAHDGTLQNPDCLHPELPDSGQDHRTCIGTSL